MKFTFYIFLLFSCLTLQAQTAVINGTVLDSENVPVTTAEIYNEETARTLTVDKAGNFTLTELKKAYIPSSFLPITTKPPPKPLRSPTPKKRKLPLS